MSKISRMARYDSLTGLPNRLLINETLAMAMAEAEKWGSRYAFMMIDLDCFKAVNDTLGQLMSTKEMIGLSAATNSPWSFAMPLTARRSNSSRRPSLMSCLNPMRSMAHAFTSAPASAFAIGPRDGRTAEMLIRSADLVLYRSKDAGGGIYHVYEPELYVQAEGTPRARNGVACRTRE